MTAGSTSSRRACSAVLAAEARDVYGLRFASPGEVPAAAPLPAEDAESGRSGVSPEPEPSSQEVEQYALRLGMQQPEDDLLLWIARAGVVAERHDPHAGAASVEHFRNLLAAERQRRRMQVSLAAEAEHAARLLSARRISEIETMEVGPAAASSGAGEDAVAHGRRVEPSSPPLQGRHVEEPTTPPTASTRVGGRSRSRLEAVNSAGAQGSGTMHGSPINMLMPFGDSLRDAARPHSNMGMHTHVRASPRTANATTTGLAAAGACAHNHDGRGGSMSAPPSASARIRGARASDPPDAPRRRCSIEAAAAWERLLGAAAGSVLTDDDGPTGCDEQEAPEDEAALSRDVEVATSRDEVAISKEEAAIAASNINTPMSLGGGAAACASAVETEGALEQSVMTEERRRALTERLSGALRREDALHQRVALLKRTVAAGERTIAANERLIMVAGGAQTGRHTRSAGETGDEWEVDGTHEAAASGGLADSDAWRAWRATDATTSLRREVGWLREKEALLSEVKRLLLASLKSSHGGGLGPSS